MVTQTKIGQNKKKRFQLYQRPWLALLAVYVVTIFSIVVVAIIIFQVIGLSDSSAKGQFFQGLFYHILASFILTPFVLRLPKGKRNYRQYLNDIGFSRIQPFFRLLILAASCYLILAFSQVTATTVYRLFQGMPIDGVFIRQLFNISGDLPPRSASLLISIPSMFEEIVFRGIILTVFLNRFSERKAILFSSAGFGLIHILNLATGSNLVWVLGQVVWAFSIGLFYGYVFTKTKSLLPSMLVHYLGNVFIGSLTGYLQAHASIEAQALYGVIFSFGLMPTALMILWTRYFSARWLPAVDQHDLPDLKANALQPSREVSLQI